MEKTSWKQQIFNLVRDLAICIIAGIAVSAAVSAVTALISAFVSKFAVHSVMNAVRSALLVTGGIFLFITGGLLLGKKGGQKIREIKKWKEMFRLLGPAGVFLIVSVSILVIASLVDYLTFFM